MLLGYAKYQIGRDRSADIVINDGSISNRHAMLIALPDGRFQLIDLHTGNGTSVREGGEFVKVDHSPPLTLDCAVRIGAYETTIDELVRFQKRRADIFISYSHSDRNRAKVFAIDLACHGWQVWWDDRLPLARDFDVVVEDQLRQCRCVVVLWSVAAVGSRWVRAEANWAFENDILVSVFIEPVEPPLLFRTLQGHFLTEWEHDTPISIGELRDKLSAMIGEPKSKPPLDIIAVTSRSGPTFTSAEKNDGWS
jgi:hypothetical protein